MGAWIRLADSILANRQLNSLQRFQKHQGDKNAKELDTYFTAFDSAGP